MNPKNWGLAGMLMMAGAVAVGMALAGTVGTLLDPILSEVESAVQGMFGGGGMQA